MPFITKIYVDEIMEDKIDFGLSCVPYFILVESILSIDMLLPVLIFLSSYHVFCVLSQSICYIMR